MQRLAWTLVAVAGCGGGSPPPRATPLAPPPEQAPPAAAGGDPAPPNMPTVRLASDLNWGVRDANGLETAIVDDPGSGRFVDVAAKTGAAASVGNIFIELAATPRTSFAGGGDPPPAPLGCSGPSSCRFYVHSIPPGQHLAATSAAWQAYGPDRGYRPLWGDAAAGPVGVLVQIKASTQPFWHMHRRDVRMVVLAGTVEFLQSGAGMHSLEPGSYVRQPGGYKHTERCTSATDCVVYIYSDNGFDVKPL